MKLGIYSPAANPNKVLFSFKLIIQHKIGIEEHFNVNFEI